MKKSQNIFSKYCSFLLKLCLLIFKLWPVVNLTLGIKFIAVAMLL